MTKAIGKREALDISALDIIAICRVLEEPTCARGAAFRAAGAAELPSPRGPDNRTTTRRDRG